MGYKHTENILKKHNEHYEKKSKPHQDHMDHEKRDHKKRVPDAMKQKQQINLESKLKDLKEKVKGEVPKSKKDDEEEKDGKKVDKKGKKGAKGDEEKDDDEDAVKQEVKGMMDKYKHTEN